MARRYGRSPSKRRLVAAVSHGRWQTTTFAAGLRQTGIVAPLVLDGSMTGLTFRAYIEQILVPSLEATSWCSTIRRHIGSTASERGSSSRRRAPLHAALLAPI